MSASGRSPRRLWLKLLLASAFGAALFEGGLRFLLTSRWTARTELAQLIGAPSRFAWPSQDMYWKFVHHLASPEAASFEPPYDPVLGWTWPGIEPLSYAHEDEALLQGRRPVLLFGDSYSACLTSSEQCFEGFMRHSLLSKRNLLLNYGVCGYGFDQTWLLTRATVERHAGSDPAVVVGLFIDDDLNRMLLSLREYPKPRLRVEDRRVVVPQQRVPSYAQWRDDPLPLPTSWAWTWVRRALGRDPLADPRSPERRELVELTRAMLHELVDDLHARDLDFFVLLFHTEHAFQLPEPADWRTQLVCDVLDELGAPWYDVREELARRLAQDGGAIGEFYIPRGQFGYGHYDVDGNEAAFAVLRRGLAEVCDVRVLPGDVPEPWVFQPRLGEGGSLAIYSAGPAAPYDHVPSEARLVLRAPRDTPSSMRYALEGLALRFRAAVWAYEPQQAPGEFELTVLVDGRPTQVLRVAAGAVPQELDVDLQGVNEFELRLAPHAARGCVVLADPLLEPAR